MDALDEQLHTLFPDPPWRLPPAVPPTGDADLDAALQLVAVNDANLDARVAEAVTRVVGAKHPDPDGALLDALRHAATGFVHFVWEPEKHLASVPEALRARAHEHYARAYGEWNARRMFLAHVVYLLDARMTDALRERLVAIVDGEAPEMMRAALAISLLGHRFGGILFGPWVRKPEAIAPRPALERLATHLRPGDALLPFAAEALLVLDADLARSRLLALVEATPPDERVAVASLVGARIVRLVDFDAAPGWVDVLGPMLRGPTSTALAMSQQLGRTRKWPALVAALRYAESEPQWAEILGILRYIDDPAAAGPLERLAESLPEAPPKSKVMRSRGAVLALSKRLSRKREVARASAPSFVVSASVGTDGGPVIVLPSSVADGWRGAPANFGAESADDDYSRACAAVDAGGVGWLVVQGQTAIVLPEQRCGVGTLADGSTLLVASGTEAMLELAMKDKRSFWPRGTWVLAGGGVVLLDASLTTARAPDGAKAALPLPPGKYKVDEIVSELPAGAVRALRLTPPKSKARPKAT